jgi:hypothetical protein
MCPSALNPDHIRPKPSIAEYTCDLEMSTGWVQFFALMATNHKFLLSTGKTLAVAQWGCELPEPISAFLSRQHCLLKAGLGIK